MPRIEVIASITPQIPYCAARTMVEFDEEPWWIWVQLVDEDNHQKLWKTRDYIDNTIKLTQFHNSNQEIVNPTWTATPESQL